MERWKGKRVKMKHVEMEYVRKWNSFDIYNNGFNLPSLEFQFLLPLHIILLLLRASMMCAAHGS